MGGVGNRILPPNHEQDKDLIVDDRLATAELAAGITAAREAAAYRSSFRNWNRRASVRVAPQRILENVQPGLLYFPQELSPGAAHPLVAAHGEQAVERLLVHRLYEYLHFTSELEVIAVIPTASRLARGQADLDLPELMRADAYKIVTDEAWHAQFSFDLLKQVERHTGIQCVQPEKPQFLRRLEMLRDQLRPDVHELADIMFAVVSETLISSILARVPRNPRVVTAVREVVRDHAEDEGRHHAYFRGLLRLVWPALDARQRRIIGPTLPDMIFAFLEPDYPATALALIDLGLSNRDAEQVLVECFPRSAVRRNHRASAEATVRYLQADGVLDEPETYESFARAGLIDA